jgi:putative thioredoxin
VERDGSDLDAKFQLAKAYVAGGKPLLAIDLLLAIATKNLAWSDGAARALLLKVFDAVGNDNPAVVAGRKSLAKLLFR